VKPFDALTFGGMSLVLLAVAFFASAAPAYRAAKTDPMTTLRTQ
jgi:ABC-type lipoprotein release transport system permease subunit